MQYEQKIFHPRIEILVILTGYVWLLFSLILNDSSFIVFFCYMALALVFVLGILFWFVTYLHGGYLLLRRRVQTGWGKKGNKRLDPSFAEGKSFFTLFKHMRAWGRKRWAKYAFHRNGWALGILCLASVGVMVADCTLQWFITDFPGMTGLILAPITFIMALLNLIRQSLYMRWDRNENAPWMH